MNERAEIDLMPLKLENTPEGRDVSWFSPRDKEQKKNKNKGGTRKKAP